MSLKDVTLLTQTLVVAKVLSRGSVSEAEIAATSTQSQSLQMNKLISYKLVSFFIPTLKMTQKVALSFAQMSSRIVFFLVFQFNTI